jgi:hypothetical protein
MMYLVNIVHPFYEAVGIERDDNLGSESVDIVAVVPPPKQVK